MTNNVRILIVDDSVVFRRTVSDRLRERANFDTAAVALDPELALFRLNQLTPDLILLDADSVDRRHLAIVSAVRAKFPKLPIVFTSARDGELGSSAPELLATGAVAGWSKKAFLQGKPDPFVDDLNCRIRRLFSMQANEGVTDLQQRKSTAAAGTKRPRQVIAVGLSTGGPEALAVFVSMLPHNLAVPVLVVQHTLASFTPYLVKQLQTQSALKIAEAKDGEVVSKGRILVAPGDFHMTVERKNNKIQVALNQLPPENSCRPAVDPLFRSVGQVYGASAIAIVLTGMGADGLRGARTLKSAGAYVIAQDQSSSVVWGMPGHVVREGLADAVRPLNEVVPELLRQL